MFGEKFYSKQHVFCFSKTNLLKKYFFKKICTKSFSKNSNNNLFHRKRTFFLQKKLFFKKSIFPFKTNLVSEKGWKNHFSKKFSEKVSKTIPNIFEYFFPKKFCLECIQKNFKKYYCQNIFFVWKTRFWPVFAANWGQKNFV